MPASAETAADNRARSPSRVRSCPRMSTGISRGIEPCALGVTLMNLCTALTLQECLPDQLAHACRDESCRTAGKLSYQLVHAGVRDVAESLWLLGLTLYSHAKVTKTIKDPPEI